MPSVSHVVAEGGQRISNRQRPSPLSALVQLIRQPLFWLVLGALVLRCLVLLLWTGAIDGEGAEYARIAQNLLWGRGYSGIAEPGKQLFFPPLFPFAIAGLGWILRDMELAARSISVVMGAVLVLPTYSAARRMFDHRIGLLAGAIVAGHPYLVYMSIRANCEMTYLTLLMSGIALTFVTISSGSYRTFALAGTSFGLAALVRPEALAYLVVSALVIVLGSLVNGVTPHAALARRIGLMLGVFALISAPYTAWLSIQTGALRLEGKSALNLATDRRIAAGEPPYAAEFGIDKSGRERGVWNQPNLVTIQQSSSGVLGLVRHLRLKARTVIFNMSQAMVSNTFGGPAMFLLVVLGILAAPWSRLQAVFHTQLLSVVGLTALGTFFIYYTADRFYVALIPAYAIWAANGCRRLTEWSTGTLRALAPGLSSRRYARLVAIGALGISALSSAVPTRDGLITEHDTQSLKAIGESLRGPSPGALRILASQTVVPFHAEATHFWLPYGNEQAALNYVQQRQIDVVVLRTHDANAIPYVGHWIQDGIPLPGAKLVQVGSLDGDSVYVYRILRL